MAKNFLPRKFDNFHPSDYSSAKVGMCLIKNAHHVDHQFLPSFSSSKKFVRLSRTREDSKLIYHGES
jgi:hypothetical protein